MIRMNSFLIVTPQSLMIHLLLFLSVTLFLNGMEEFKAKTIGLTVGEMLRLMGEGIITIQELILFLLMGGLMTAAGTEFNSSGTEMLGI